MKPFEKLTSWYFSKKALPYWSVLFLDYVIATVCGILAYTLGHGTIPTIEHLPEVAATFAFYSLFYIIGFRVFHTYAGVLRFSTSVDLGRIGLAMILGLFIAMTALFLFDLNRFLTPVTPRDLLFGTLMAIAATCTIRIWVKTLYEESINGKRTSRAFIYGIKDSAVSLAKSLNSDRTLPYHLGGFLTDDPDMVGRHLLGHKVYAANSDAARIMTAHGVDTLLVARYKSEDLRNNTELVNPLIDKGIKIMVFPNPHGFNKDSAADNPENGKKLLTSLREVNVDDLLPRKKIEVDMEAIGSQLRGKRILITGAAGSIGSEMVRQVAPFEPSELLLIDQAETPLHDIRLMMARHWPEIKALTIVGDISNSARMEEIFRRHRPEYVFHAAAYKHVPMMEDNPAESVTNNITGTRVIADLAVKYSTRKFVMVSTDKAVNPTNVMGCSKRICEIYVQALDKAIKDGKVDGTTRFITTRFGNVLGSNGSVIPLFQEQIKAGGPVTVTHPEIIRYFMLIPEACKLVLEAGTMGKGGEIFVFDMGEPVKIADLARRMISLSGARNIEIKFTGLREGEKLYEEMLNDKEITLPTFHSKIKIARVREYDFSSVAEQIHSLERVSTESDDDMEIVRMMKQIVPEYRSRNSRYEAIDRASASDR